jgi:4-amino-4-deoxy-L-arabinose transferase-like glycosyltransferase
MPYLGTGDHHIWKIWSYAGATNPLGHIYRLQNDDRPPLTLDNIQRALSGQVKLKKWLYEDRADYVDYPPVTPLLFGLLGRVYLAFSPEYANTPWLNALVKIPALLADIAATCLIYLVAGRYYSRRFALGAAAIYWFNPMAILAGPLLAYQDPVYAVFLIASVTLLAGGRHAWGWAMFALALLTKPQPVVALPALALAGLARRNFARLMGYVVTAGVAVLVVLLPFLAAGTVVNLIANNMRNTSERYLSANNTNFWWLASYARDIQRLTGEGMDFATAAHVTTQITFMPDLVASGLPDPKPLGVVLFVVFTLVVGAVWWIRFGGTPEARQGLSPNVAELAALQIYGATMLLTQVHENHAYGAAALLGVAWWLNGAQARRPDRELLALYVALSAVVFFNLLIFYGFGEQLGQKVVPRDILWLDLSVINTLLNIGVFGWWLWRWIRPLPLPGARRQVGLHVGADQLGVE